MSKDLILRWAVLALMAATAIVAPFSTLNVSPLRLDGFSAPPPAYGPVSPSAPVAPGVEAPVAPVVPEAPVAAPDAMPRTATDAVLKVAEENGSRAVFFDAAGAPVTAVVIPGSVEFDSPVIVTRPGDFFTVEWTDGVLTLIFIEHDQRRDTYIYATG